MSELRILAIGDVVGRPGRRAVRELLGSLRERYAPCFVVANAENAAGGSGITLDTARELLDSGCDCLTAGDHFFENRGVEEVIEKEPRVLRPANWSRHAPGRGWGVFGAAGGLRVAAINLMGRTFMRFTPDSFFDAADELVEKLRAETPVIAVDFHAEATSEKLALGRHLDGRVSFVFGTHTHVQTADERVLAGGTAYITDLGMAGPHDSILGRESDAIVARLRAQVPTRFEVAKGDVRLCGAVATVEDSTGRALSVERLQIRLPKE